jgi:hypothetical protein
LTMTYQVSEKFLSTTEQVYDKATGKLISSVLSIPTHTNLEVRISTITYSFASPVESKVTVYKLSHNEKG